MKEFQYPELELVTASNNASDESNPWNDDDAMNWG